MQSVLKAGLSQHLGVGCEKTSLMVHVSGPGSNTYPLNPDHDPLTSDQLSHFTIYELSTLECVQRLGEVRNMRLQQR